MQAAAQLVEKEAAAGRVGLEPLAVDDQLRDGPLPRVADYFVGGVRVAVDIDFSIGDAVGIEKLLRGAAVAAPCGGVNLHCHRLILPGIHCYHL